MKIYQFCLVLSLNPLNAQAGFTCACPTPGLNIDAGEGTDITEFLGLGPITINNTGRCIAILGTLQINANVTITGGEIRMQPGSRIILTDSGRLTLNGVNQNGGVHGCEEMWRGIAFDVISSSSATGFFLNLTDSEIQDAEFAVTLEKRTTLNSTNTVFNRNFVGVLLEGNLPNPAVGGNLNMDIDGTTFSSSGTMLDPYDGQVNYAETTYSGILLRDVVTNPQIGALNNDPNLFTGLTNGILAYRSRATIRNNEFEEIYYELAEGGYFPMTPTGQTFGNAIGCYRGSALTIIEENVFDNCEVGIQASLTSLRVDDNTMTDANHGVLVFQSGGRIIRLINNTIEANYGLLVYSGTTAANILEITDNQITCAPTITGAGGGTGIHIGYFIGATGTSLNAAPGSHEIVNNIVTVSAFSGDAIASGISVTAGGVLLDQNVVTMYNKGWGILANLCQQGILNENIIKTFTDEYVYGISIYNSPNIRVLCNESQATGLPIAFEGDCGCNAVGCTQINGNTMQQLEPPTGFFGAGLNLRNAITSEQIWNGNKWADADNGTYGAAYSGNPDLADYSFFIVHTAAIPYHPQTISVTGGLPSLWFSAISGDFFECEDMLDDDIPDEQEDIFEAIAGDSLSLSGYGAGAQWMASQALFRTIESDSGLLTNPDLDDFYDNNENAPIGLISVIEERLSRLEQKPGELAAYLDSLSTEIDEISLDLMEVEEDIEVAFPTVPSYLLEDQEDLMEQLEVTIAGRDSLEEDWMEYREEVIDSLVTLTASLSVSGVPATNKKVVLEILLDMLLANASEPDSLQRIDLESIAIQCPSVGGDAVYQANTLLHRLYFYDDCLEEEEEELRIQQPELVSTNTIQTETTIYPNPATNKATLETREDLASFTLYDALGRLVWQRQNLSVGQHVIDLSGLSPGTYHYKTQSAGAQHGAGKLIILP